MGSLFSALLADIIMYDIQEEILAVYQSKNFVKNTPIINIGFIVMFLYMYVTCIYIRVAGFGNGHPPPLEMILIDEKIIAVNNK